MPEESTISSCNPEFDAACERFNKQIQAYSHEVTAALDTYVKAVEASAELLRKAQQDVFDALQKCAKP